MVLKAKSIIFLLLFSIIIYVLILLILSQCKCRIVGYANREQPLIQPRAHSLYIGLYTVKKKKVTFTVQEWQLWFSDLYSKKCGSNILRFAD